MIVNGALLIKVLRLIRSHTLVLFSDESPLLFQSLLASLCCRRSSLLDDCALQKLLCILARDSLTVTSFLTQFAEGYSCKCYV